MTTFTETEIPTVKDETPPLDNPSDFVSEYPGATPDAPYGYKADGTPYRRRPRGTAPSRSSTSKRMPASESQARAAAALLTQVNSLSCMGIMAIGFTDTASAIANANEGFEQMAYEALLTDPALCKTILKAGSTSGKVALFIAYGMLATSVAPVAVNEYRTKRDAARAESESETYE